jgi:hypothetical protein
MVSDAFHRVDNKTPQVICLRCLVLDETSSTPTLPQVLPAALLNEDPYGEGVHTPMVPRVGWLSNIDKVSLKPDRKPPPPPLAKT